MNQSFFSREQRAGYDPQINASIDALVVGTGALSQSLLLTLCLAQVGNVRLVDFDAWDEHNATRSPLFGTPEQRSRLKNLKAPCVAEQLAERTWWSHLPKIHYAVGRIQELGDQPFQEASIVISGVDDPAARADIALMCLRHQVPLVEGGVANAAGSFAVYDGQDNPCWQCGTPDALRARVPAGCAVNAIDQARQGYIGMTQSLVAITGAYMAEAAIQLAHGNRDLIGKRIYLDDIRSPSISIVKESIRSSCPLPHEPIGNPDWLLATRTEAPVEVLLKELSKRCGEPRILLRAPYVAHEACAGPLTDAQAHCGRVVAVGKPDWAISRHPRCHDCGGNYPLAPDQDVAIYPHISQHDRQLYHLSCQSVGIVAGEILEIETPEGVIHTGLIPQCTSPFVMVPKAKSQTTHRSTDSF